MDSHYILALETSSSLCDVALLSSSGSRVGVRSLSHDATGEHAERLLPLADSLLMQAGIGRGDLTAIAFGQGPGGFTGLRVACGVAQGIAFALDLPVIPVVSLLAVAARDHSQDGSGDPQNREFIQPVRVLVQDARMGEVYLAAYRLESPGGDRPDDWRALQEPILLDAADVGAWLVHVSGGWRDAQGRPLPVRLLGDALSAYPELMAFGAEMIGVAAGAGRESPLRSGSVQHAAQQTDRQEPTRKAGSGEGIRVQFGESLRPTAEAIARLALTAWRQGGGLPPEQAAPLYVRDKIAFTTLERQQGLGGNPKAAGFSAGDSAGAGPANAASDEMACATLAMASAAPARAAPTLPDSDLVKKAEPFSVGVNPSTEASIEVSIERMTLVHLNAVVHIEQSVQSFPWTRENFFDALHAGYGAWVAMHEGTIAGFYLTMFAPDVAHLLLIAVAPEKQRKGVGAALLRHSERESLEHGLDSLILEVRPSNGSALAFYRRHGFISLSVRKGYYPLTRSEREDALVLQKKLLASGDIRG